MKLKTKRLLLNAFNEADAVLVTKLAGDKRVVEMTEAIPYPYEVHMAISWIQSHQKEREDNLNDIFAIRLLDNENLIGCINISLNAKHNRGYLGFWIGHKYWNQGYCTEALKRIIKFGFEEKKLNKIWAEHKTINVASGRVMEKAKMKHEGIMRNHYKQSENDYIDMSVKSILKNEYE